MNQDKYLSITAITKYIKFKLDNDQHLKNVFLKGEISNFKAHTTGHLYFSLKDENTKINAIMFRTQASKLNFIPQDGTKVLVVGRISVYESTGNYQIYIDEMQEDGVGNLYIAFEKLKQELSKEGLFEQKRKLPKYPKKIGIVTASTGAAIKDIISTIKRRYPICETYLFPSLVQGENAAPDIVNKINQANQFDLDLLIIGRGGGSIEDLWPFNEEIVARAIYNSKIPTISAVGHEIDYTIADFVADLRAPTPTGAAEMAVPNLVDVENYINQLKIRLNESIYKKINYNKLYLDSIKNSYCIKSPMIMYENKKQQISLLMEKIINIVNIELQNNQKKLDNLKNNFFLTNPENLYKSKQIDLNNIIDKLELINPLKVLKRGYSLTYKNEKIVNNINDISINDVLKIKLTNGEIITKVTKIEEK